MEDQHEKTTQDVEDHEDDVQAHSLLDERHHHTDGRADETDSRHHHTDGRADETDSRHHHTDG